MHPSICPVDEENLRFHKITHPKALQANAIGNKSDRYRVHILVPASKQERISGVIGRCTVTIHSCLSPTTNKQFIAVADGQLSCGVSLKQRERDRQIWRQTGRQTERQADRQRE